MYPLRESFLKDSHPSLNRVAFILSRFNICISCKNKAKRSLQQAFSPLFFVSLMPCLFLSDNNETLVRHMTNKRFTTVAQASGN